MSNKNRIGIELGLDGIKRVEGQLGDVAEAAKSAAAETGKAFDRAAYTAANATQDAAQEAETAAARIKRAFAAVAGTIKKALSTVTRSVAGVSMSITRGLGRAGMAGGRALANGIRSGIERSKSIIQTALAGVTAGAAGVFAGTVESATFTELQARFARAGGTSLGNFGELSSIARQFGAADDELLGAFSTFSDKLAEASRGEGAKAFFDELGISAVDASGKVRDTGVVFRELTQALRNVKSDSKRANYANELLGGDAEKLASVLALSKEELEARSRLAREAGTVVSPEQLARTRRFLDSWRGLQETLKGFLLTVADRVYPTLVILFDDVARWIRENRQAIADWIAGGFNRLVSIVRDLVNAFTGNRGAVSRGWVLALADILVAVGRAASNVIGLFSKFGPTIGESLGKGVIALRDFAASFLVAFGSGGTALDLFGTNAESDRSNRIVQNIDKNGAKRTKSRYAKKGERVLPFTVDEQTSQAAVGFAGALSGMKERLASVFDVVKETIVNKVIPALQLMYAAMMGDPVAQQRIVDWVKSVLLSIRNEIDAWAASIGPVADGIWMTLTGRYSELPEDNPIRSLIDDIIDLKNQAKEAWQTIADLWKPIQDMTGITPLQAVIYGAFLSRVGAAASLAGMAKDGAAALFRRKAAKEVVETAGKKAVTAAAAGSIADAAGDAVVIDGKKASVAEAEAKATKGFLKNVKGGTMFLGRLGLIGAAIAVGSHMFTRDRIAQFFADIEQVTGISIGDTWQALITTMEETTAALGRWRDRVLLDFSMWLMGSADDQAQIEAAFKSTNVVPKTGYTSIEIPKPTTGQDLMKLAPANSAPARAESQPVILQIGGNKSGTLYGTPDVVNALTRSIERSNRLAVAGK